MFVPRQAPGRREPARVSSGAFTVAGLPVPGHPAQRNIYQLTGRRGLPWTPGLDAHLRRRGGELPGHGELILVDIDTPAAVDGMPMIDALVFDATPVVTTGEERDALFERYAAMQPQLVLYQSRTARQIPVVAVSRREDRAPAT